MAVFRVERNKGYTVMSNHHLRNKELTLKAKGLLSQMLSLPDGRKKTLFCVAVNLLELQEINEILLQIKGNSELERLTLKEKSSYAAGVFQNAAKRKNIELKLRKKK